jgi:hypothetical protein
LSNHTAATFPWEAAQAATKHNSLSCIHDTFKSCDWVNCQDEMHESELYVKAIVAGFFNHSLYLHKQNPSDISQSFSSISE